MAVSKKVTKAASEIDLEKVKEAANVNLVQQLQEKTFNSGKTGFYAQNKIVVDGVRFQSQIMLVEIAPKS